MEYKFSNKSRPKNDNGNYLTNTASSSLVRNQYGKEGTPSSNGNDFDLGSVVSTLIRKGTSEIIQFKLPTINAVDGMSQQLESEAVFSPAYTKTLNVTNIWGTKQKIKTKGILSNLGITHMRRYVLLYPAAGTIAPTTADNIRFYRTALANGRLELASRASGKLEFNAYKDNPISNITVANVYLQLHSGSKDYVNNMMSDLKIDNKGLALYLLDMFYHDSVLRTRAKWNALNIFISNLTLLMKKFPSLQAQIGWAINAVSTADFRSTLINTYNKLSSFKLDMTIVSLTEPLAAAMTSKDDSISEQVMTLETIAITPMAIREFTVSIGGKPVTYAYDTLTEELFSYDRLFDDIKGLQSKAEAIDYFKTLLAKLENDTLVYYESFKYLNSIFFAYNSKYRTLPLYAAYNEIENTVNGVKSVMYSTPVFANAWVQVDVINWYLSQGLRPIDSSVGWADLNYPRLVGQDKKTTRYYDLLRGEGHSDNLSSPATVMMMPEAFVNATYAGDTVPEDVVQIYQRLVIGSVDRIATKHKNISWETLSSDAYYTTQPEVMTDYWTYLQILNQIAGQYRTYTYRTWIAKDNSIQSTVGGRKNFITIGITYPNLWDTYYLFFDTNFIIETVAALTTSGQLQ